jgi:hypothetical protein
MFYDNFKIGDKITYNINVGYKMTGEVETFTLTDKILEQIKKYEDYTNFHNMRIIT